MLFRAVLTLALLCAMLCSSGWSQAIPSTASANLYFPHFVVGGAASDYWVTSFDFANPYDRSVRLWLYGQNSAGQPMSLQLGGKTATEHIFDIPASGSFTLASPTAPQALQFGWVDAYANMPIQGIATYTRIRNGVPIAKVTAESAMQTVQYLNIANRNLGLALANRSGSPIKVFVLVSDHNGVQQGEHPVDLPAWGHTAFNLYTPFPNLPQDFRGTVSVTSESGAAWFLAWSLTDDGSGVSSALPAGGFRRPVNQRDRIENVFYSLMEAFDEQVGGAIPELTIIDDVAMGPNAFARSRVGDVEEVGITLALGELLADSSDELAAVIAHELGHVAQFREGGTVYDANPERDADIRGTILALGARYDPYALAGALSKLSMASGQVGLMTQWEAFSSGEIHGSFNERLSTAFQTLVAICAMPEVDAFCEEYRSIFHPHLPAAPLQRGGSIKTHASAVEPGPTASARPKRGNKDAPLRVDRSKFRFVSRALQTP